MAQQNRNKKSDGDWRPEFESALAAAFGEYVCPPVPFNEPTFGAWIQAVLSVVGRRVMPSDLAQLSQSEMADLAQKFAARFACKAPKVVQIQTAIAQTLARFQPPDASRGEKAEPNFAADGGA